MQIIDLFSGIGGFSLAGRWVGWHTIQFCEIDKFGQRVLGYHFPNIPIHPDVKTLTGEQIINNGLYDPRETTIIVGGFPCQPFSAAGKRRGTEDDRHLWPECIRLVREVKPDFCVFENVFGIVSWDGGLVFEQVQADLEAEGYEVQPYILPACAVNAPHRRDRVWFVSRLITNSSCTGRNGDKESKEGCNSKRTGILQYESHALCSIGASADTSITGREEWQQNRGRQDAEKVRAGMDNRPERHGNIRVIADTKSTGTGQDIRGLRSVSDRHSEGIQDATPYTRLLRPQGAGEQTAGVEQCDEGDVADTSNQGLERSEIGRGIRSEWEKSHKQPSRFIRPDWQNFPTVSPLCDRNDGLSDRLSGITFSKWRNESIKAMGNAIVPQVVYQIFKAIEQYERLNP